MRSQGVYAACVEHVSLKPVGFSHISVDMTWKFLELWEEAETIPFFNVHSDRTYLTVPYQHFLLSSTFIHWVIPRWTRSLRFGSTRLGLRVRVKPLDGHGRGRPWGRAQPAAHRPRGGAGQLPRGAAAAALRGRWTELYGEPKRGEAEGEGPGGSKWNHLT